MESRRPLWNCMLSECKKVLSLDPWKGKRSYNLMRSLFKLLRMITQGMWYIGSKNLSSWVEECESDYIRRNLSLCRRDTGLSLDNSYDRLHQFQLCYLLTPLSGYNEKIAHSCTQFGIWISRRSTSRVCVARPIHFPRSFNIIFSSQSLY